jgi:hypothetical protein
MATSDLRSHKDAKLLHGIIFSQRRALPQTLSIVPPVRVVHLSSVHARMAPDGSPAQTPFGFPASPCSDLQYGSDRPTRRADGAGPMVVALWAFTFVLFILGGAAAGVVDIGLGVLLCVNGTTGTGVNSTAHTESFACHNHLSDGEAVALGLTLVFFALIEGYVGFHCSWSPATARRCYLAGYAASGPCSVSTASVIAFAPLFAAGYFFAPLRRLCVSYFLVVFIVGLVIAVKQCPSPWHEVFNFVSPCAEIVPPLIFMFVRSSTAVSRSVWCSAPCPLLSISSSVSAPRAACCPRMSTLVSQRSSPQTGLHRTARCKARCC